MEANKILFHLMKDNSENERKHHGRWLLKASGEAIEALNAPEVWEQGSRGMFKSQRGYDDKGIGKGKSSSSASSSSNPWEKGTWTSSGDGPHQARDVPPWESGASGTKGYR